jgi:uncharacterized protein (TIGR00251 family)
MIALADHPEGCILPVRAQPRSRRNGILGEHAGSLKVAVTAPPDQGRANQALLEVLQEAFDLKRSQVTLLSGATSREKKFLIRDLSKQELQQKLASHTNSKRQ